MAHRRRQDYAFETAAEDSRARDDAVDATLEREAQEYVERHVDPDLLPPPEPEPGRVGRAFDVLTRTEDPIAIAQGTFFVASGVWPLINMPSFEAVTGPKMDRWLVKTVGALVAVSGAAMASAGLRGRITPETRLLAMGSSLALAAIDVVYARRKRISRIYLLDAVAEIGLVLAWLTAMGRQPDELEPAPA
ncbi:MAG TPA: hypothetical protein VFH62_02840 [Dehalococcoidia bacterium]|jgi:hypothetical protein|nr:hypothetical protein [Dehalococcoidia bacterium]